MIRQLLSKIIYPLLLIGGFLLFIGFYNHGYSGTILLVVSIPLSFFVVLILEFIIPERKDWLSSFGLYDVTDFVHLGLSKLGNRLAGIVAPLLAFTISHNNIELWPVDIPYWMQVLLFFIIADLMEYIRHRLSHEWNILWRVHAIHHSAKAMNVFRSGRFHFLDIAFAGLLVNVPLLILGAPKELFLYHGIVIVLQNSLAHANIRMASPKWFTAVILTNAHHFLHHDLNKNVRNTNYAGIFTLWDRVFKTYSAPRNVSNLKLGIDDYHYPKNIFAQIVKPIFRPFQ